MIQQEKNILQRILPHLFAIFCFLAITLIYFSPELQGKVLVQSDTTHYIAASQEVRSYYENDGQPSAWTGAMFSGMPSYQIGVWGGSKYYLNYLDAPLRFLGSTMGATFTGMVMAYILFLCLGMNPIIALLGGIAYSLSSYNIIILDAGHLTKAWAIAYMPLIISGLLVLFRKKYFIGSILLACGLALQLKSNHLQITYYTAILCGILFLSFLVKSIVQKEIPNLLKVTGICIAVVLLAVLCNIGSLYSNYEMGNESIRGKSELTITPPGTTTPTQPTTGLDKDYVFQWSYGKAETFSLLIPNIYGGASGGLLGPSSNLYKATSSNLQNADLPADGIQSQTYWGDQPGTSGPVYFGAIICFLFLLGMYIIPSKMKWIFLAATLFFIFLSWGKNLPAFNDWFYYHFPLYGKFRAVSMALVIPAMTMLVVAVWGLNEFVNGNIPKEKLRKALYISAGITGGICLLLWLLPSMFFNFTSIADAQLKSQIPPQYTWYYPALLADRKDLLTSDALRSLIFIVLAAATLYFSLKLKRTKWLLIGIPSIIAVLVLVDLWGVDQRYLNNSMFQEKEYVNDNVFHKTPADNAILKDKTPSYRVLNMAGDTFNDAITSYYHKSIGGYSAAKLKRYQSLIEFYIQPEMQQIIASFKTQNVDTIMHTFASTKVLNMLNAKYIIYNPAQPPLMNTHALGNAWFVKNYQLVNNADEEILGLKKIDPAQTVLVDKRFDSDLSNFKPMIDSTAKITLTSYTPRILTYKTKAKSEQLVVFSEIYYDKGWNAYVDGKLTPHFRADWTLRAMRIPAGEHDVVFKFEPQTYLMCRTVSSIATIILLLLLVCSVGLSIFKIRKK